MARRKDGSRRGSPPLRGSSGQAPRIVPNKNRRLQVAPTRRKLFDPAAKDEFLEWFAATCNCSLSARKTGFHYRTVIRHWREDEAFGARCRTALEMAYPRLEELALRAAEEALRGAKPAPDGDRAAPAETFAMDPSVALQLLREHKLGLAGAAGGSGRGAKPGRAPTVASTAEVHDALVKRLRAFGIRIEREEAGAGAEKAEEAEKAEKVEKAVEDAPPPPSGPSPSPGNPGEDEAASCAAGPGAA